MAFVVPALAAVGGGSAVTGAMTLAAFGLGTWQAIEQKKASNQQKNQIKIQAKTEAAAGAQREVERRRNLVRALASQNAAAGAGGIQTDGSVEAIARRDIRDSNNDLLASNANTDARQRALRARASNASRSGNLSAATSLLDGANNAYRTYKAGG